MSLCPEYERCDQALVFPVRIAQFSQNFGRDYRNFSVHATCYMTSRFEAVLRGENRLTATAGCPSSKGNEEPETNDTRALRQTA